MSGYRYLARGPARWPAALFIGAFRNLPVLVVMFFVRFGLPLVGVSIRSAFIAAVVALTVYNTAMIAELLRGSLDSVGRGQNEAALAGGLSRAAAFFWVILPQGGARSLPALAGHSSFFCKGHPSSPHWESRT